MARSIFFYTDSRVLGGAENAMFMLLGSLDRGEWEPTLLLEDAPEVEPLAARAAALGVPVRRIPPLPLGLAGARRVPGLARLLRRERPAVFHAHMSSPVACKWGLVAAVLARVPAVLGTVQVGAYEPDRSSFWQLRLLARKVDRFLAVSREIATELVEDLRWPAEKVEIVYNAVDVERAAVPAPPGLRAQLGGSETRPLVLTPARLNAQKGHDTLLEAIAELPEALFLLAGDGPERERLEARAAELGVAERVRFLGRREDVPRLLAACDVFCLPSLYEGSSLAVLEAMAAGIAIVSSAIGGTEELIEDGRSGLLVRPGDAPALAAALRRLLGDPELREQLAQRARERVDAGLRREQNAEQVEKTYRELLATNRVRLSFEADSATNLNHTLEGLPESRRNPLLRQEDWRFLLPEAELLAHWRVPRPGGIRRARRRAEAAGYADVRAYWAGPLPHRLPQFWLPLDSEEATDHLLASRAPRSWKGVLLRRVWSALKGAGLLAPVYVVGRRPEGSGDELPVSPGCQLLLLTTGHRSINKAVGLAFGAGEPVPDKAVKFARVSEAEPGLEREAEVLRGLREERPDLAGVPRLVGEGSRNGHLAVVQEAVAGESLLDALAPENFEDVAMRVTRLLVELARTGDPTQAAEWRERLVAEPLEWFERHFGPAAGAGGVLDGLGELPATVEHRDCSPWNLLLTPAGDPVLLDWESSEPAGLPGPDLVYFLANCAFVLDGALESGRTRETYARLLDPATPHGRVAAAAIAEYTGALGISAEDFRRLRLLTWIVHSRSDYRHLRLESPGEPSAEALRGAPFFGLVEEELRRG